jgi:hypothetical protein
MAMGVSTRSERRAIPFLIFFLRLDGFRRARLACLDVAEARAPSEAAAREARVLIIKL